MFFSLRALRVARVVERRVAAGPPSSARRLLRRVFRSASGVFAQSRLHFGSCSWQPTAVAHAVEMFPAPRRSCCSHVWEERACHPGTSAVGRRLLAGAPGRRTNHPSRDCWQSAGSRSHFQTVSDERGSAAQSFCVHTGAARVFTRKADGRLSPLFFAAGDSPPGEEQARGYDHRAPQDAVRMSLLPPIICCVGCNNTTSSTRDERPMRRRLTVSRALCDGVRPV